MDIQIRTGDALECDYTGKEARALVRIKPGDDLALGEGRPEAWTGWMGRDALEQAFRMLSVAEGAPPPPTVNVASATPPAFAPPPAPAAPFVPPEQLTPGAWQKPANDPALIMQFRRAAERLAKRAENEAPDEGKASGINETDIRELIMEYRDGFPNPVAAMFPVLNALFGMERQRLDVIVKSRDVLTKSEREEEDRD